MNTLDEAITHCKEKVEKLKQKAETNKFMAQEKETCENAGKVSKYIYSAKELEEIVNECLECASEHEQLAGWLEELKELRSFAEFVTREVLDEDFEEGSGAFAEITCRKLVKLGYVVLDGDTYKRGNENDNFET